jgi:hypothetical protein
MARSFIVGFWSSVFSGLSRLSIFWLLRKLAPQLMSARFVDAWVMGHVAVALVAVFAVDRLGPHSIVSTALVIYGLVRVFEIAVYQVNVLLFDEYRAVRAGRRYALHGYRRIILLLIHNYVEIILWLACTYALFSADFVHKWEGGARTMLGSIYSSFITMTTFGDFDLLPNSNLAAVILIFHSTVGLFMTLLSLARFISLIPEPDTRDPEELLQRHLAGTRRDAMVAQDAPSEANQRPE